jgi:hypothetical protein
VLRRLAIVVVAALVATGCGGEDEVRRSDVAENVATLCDEARKDIEALGLPSETGIAVLTPWANRGTRLAHAIAALQGTTPAETRDLRSLATALEEYYAGLRLGHKIYQQTKSSDAYASTIDRAKAFLADADRVANRLAVPECTVRPFDDE